MEVKEKTEKKGIKKTIRDWKEFLKVWEEVKEKLPYSTLLIALLRKIPEIPSSGWNGFIERVEFVVKTIENLSKKEANLLKEALKALLDLFNSKKFQPYNTIRRNWPHEERERELVKRLLRILAQVQLKIINDPFYLSEARKLINDLYSYCVMCYYWPPNEPSRPECWKLAVRAAINLEHYELLLQISKLKVPREVINQILSFLKEKIVKKWKKKYPELPDEELIKKAFINGDKGAIRYLQLNHISQSVS